MPRGANSKKQTTSMSKADQSTNIDKFGFDDDLAATPDSQNSTSKAKGESNSKKRSYPDEDLQPEEERFGNEMMEMQKMLKCFGADISKNIAHKRKRLEQLTQSSVKVSSRKVDEIWTAQQTQRTKLNDEFTSQTTNVFKQLEVDLEKSKDQEEKLENVFHQMQKMFQQTRIVYGQRLKTIKQMQDQYVKSLKDLESHHQQQIGNVQAELKKEMSSLQKKILMDTQQQEMTNVRKSLQSMLF